MGLSLERCVRRQCHGESAGTVWQRAPQPPRNVSPTISALHLTCSSHLQHSAPPLCAICHSWGRSQDFLRAAATGLHRMGWMLSLPWPSPILYICLFIGGDTSLSIPFIYCCINSSLKLYDLTQFFYAKSRCCRLGTWTGFSWAG